MSNALDALHYNKVRIARNEMKIIDTAQYVQSSLDFGDLDFGDPRKLVILSI